MQEKAAEPDDSGSDSGKPNGIQDKCWREERPQDTLHRPELAVTPPLPKVLPATPVMVTTAQRVGEVITQVIIFFVCHEFISSLSANCPIKGFLILLNDLIIIILDDSRLDSGKPNGIEL